MCKKDFLAYHPKALRCKVCRYEKIKKTATTYRNHKYKTDKLFRELTKEQQRKYYHRTKKSGVSVPAKPVIATPQGSH